MYWKFTNCQEPENENKNSIQKLIYQKIISNWKFRIKNVILELLLIIKCILKIHS